MTVDDGARRLLGAHGWSVMASPAQSEPRASLGQTIFESSPVCVMVVGRDGALLDTNRAGLHLIEGDSVDAVRGFDVGRLLDLDQRPALAAAIEAVTCGATRALQFEVTGWRGGRRWVDMRASPMRDSPTGPVAALCILTDATDPKGSDALRQNEARMALAADISAIGFFEHDHISDTIYWSDGAVRIYGLESGRADTRAMLKAVYPEDLDRVLSRIAAAHDPSGSGSMFLDSRVVWPDGQVRRLQTRSQTYFGDREGQRVPLRTVGAVVDVTDRYESEARLRRSEERLAMAAEVAGLGFFEHDHDTNAVFWSNGMHRLVQLDLSQEFERIESFRRILHPDDVDRAEALVQAAHDPAGDGRMATEYRIRWPNGEVRHLRMQSQTHFVERNGTRVPDKTVGAAWDITERKRAEAAHDALALRVLEAQENERRAVARDLHDEIGQALSALTLNLHQMRREAVAVAPLVDDSLRIAGEALRQARHLALSLRPSVLDDLGLGAAVQWYAERTADRAGLTLTSQIDADCGRLTPATEIACFRVLQEALTNVTRHAHAKALFVSLQVNGSSLELVVRDDGRGFAVDARPDSATDGPATMGLMGIRERASLLGGSASVVSAPGCGCELRVSLPVTRREGAAG